ncbi:MAG TPA: hypothetical protein VEF53_11845 [Patescibacteria group bacterium]|nr:hypothetical protein [Patescibacteria group bacterium]
MVTRIWCEFTSPMDVCREFVLRILKKYNVILNYKLEYKQADSSFFDMIKIYNENNIPVSIWATMRDDMGYWINEKNAHNFDSYIRELLEEIERQKLSIKGVCIDMETPLKDVQRLANPRSKLDPVILFGKAVTHNLNKNRYNKAKEILKETCNYIREKNLESYATCARHCYYDLRFNSEIMQNAMEIPVFDIEWDKYNLMYYATMIRQELNKVKRVNVDYLIYHQIKHLKETLKDKLAVSVGVTNVGKLGNEPHYESIEEFSKDIGILKECGVEDFSLFSLDGIMQENKLEDFLSAMHNAKPAKPNYCKKVIRNEALAELLIKIGNAYYGLF